MREIKFRAWDGIKMRDVGILLIGHGATGYGHEENEVTIGTEDTLRILMQFTGLKDKYGKEIYEGDILKIMERDVSAIPSEVKQGSHYLAVVEYDGGRFDGRDTRTGGGWHWSGWSKHEIIGSIYENPDLINSKN
jgi:uncharacterized phage protein (TIGR01671 family)